MINIESGTVVNISGTQMILGAQLGRGGEGTVFGLAQSELSLCVKIYHEPLSPRQIEKLEMMSKHRHAQMFTRKQICWPLGLVEHEGRVVGYLMRQVPGGLKKLAILMNPVARRRDSSWTRTDMCVFLKTWLAQVEELHSQRILIGDINDQNILVDPENAQRVFLVDVDSFQIEHFSCPVGRPDFTPPELQGQRLVDIQRTVEHELFPIAITIFKAFVGSKNPYAVQGGGAPSENIQNGVFPYPYGDEAPTVIPAGRWEGYWKALSLEMKEAFHKAFRQNNRPSVGDWLRYIDAYEQRIKERDFSDLLDDVTDVVLKKAAKIDDGRKRGKGNAENILTSRNEFGMVGILELSTRAVKGMCVHPASLWDRFSWGKPHFTNKSVLSHTGQLLQVNQELDLPRFRARVLPRIHEVVEFLKERSVTHIYVVATAVYRTAENRDEVLELIKKEVDLDVQILDRNEEARQTFNAFKWVSGGAFTSDMLLIDQGGGSTEIALFDAQGELLQRGNIPLGTEATLNSLFNNFDRNFRFVDALRESPRYVRRNIVDNTRELVQRIESRQQPFSIIALGSAITRATGKKGNPKQHGTMLTKGQLVDYRNSRVGVVEKHPAQTVAEFYAYIEQNVGSSSGKKRGAYDAVIDYLGCMVYKLLLERFQQSSLTVSGAGLRYGVTQTNLDRLAHRHFGRAFGEGELPKELAALQAKTQAAEQTTYGGLSVGDIVRGKVRNTLDFGVFVQLKPNLDGLLHVSQLPQGISPDHYQWGQLIDVKISGIQERKGQVRISLKLA